MRQKLQKKHKQVEELSREIEDSKVVAILDLTNLPSAQFQLIKSKIRDKFKIKVAKKTIILRAIEKIKHKKHNIEELEKSLDHCIPAIVLTDEDPFKMSKIFKDNKSKSLAKSGQISPLDITIPSGPTQFAPGPIIGELGQAGIKAAIEQGKVVIKEAKLVVKEGEEIFIGPTETIIYDHRDQEAFSFHCGECSEEHYILAAEAGIPEIIH